MNTTTMTPAQRTAAAAHARQMGPVRETDDETEGFLAAVLADYSGAPLAFHEMTDDDQAFCRRLAREVLDQ